jgi:hypothetical protein
MHVWKYHNETRLYNYMLIKREHCAWRTSWRASLDSRGNSTRIHCGYLRRLPGQIGNSRRLIRGLGFIMSVPWPLRIWTSRSAVWCLEPQMKPNRKITARPLRPDSTYFHLSLFHSRTHYPCSPTPPAHHSSPVSSYRAAFLVKPLSYLSLALLSTGQAQVLQRSSMLSVPDMTPETRGTIQCSQLTG